MSAAGLFVADAHGTARLAEADRLMSICNACRYCEGLCAVFPAMERRRLFTDGDLDFLTNLCHGCGACLYDCQYAPPHSFAVNVPRHFAELRRETYERYAWPAPLARAFRRNGIATAGAVAAGVAAFVIGVSVAHDGDVTFGRHRGEGAFYAVVPHAVMVVVFLLAALFAVVAMAMSVRRYWRAIGGGRPTMADLRDAGQAAATLRYLDGGGVGCMNDGEEPDDNRRLFHHLTFYGLAACFASTTLAAVLETGFDRQAPYAPYHPVVVLGIVGGLGVLAGTAGLARAKSTRDPELVDAGSRTMEVAFLALLAATALSGFAVLLLRTTAAMGILLAVHLGVVAALFVTAPYGKFVHGLYRSAALVRDAMEARR
jgi:citrate/tricarballylate utilization protein